MSTVSINVAAVKTAIQQEAAKASLTLTASGSDTWDTGSGSIGRSFSVTVQK